MRGETEEGENSERKEITTASNQRELKVELEGVALGNNTRNTDCRDILREKVEEKSSIRALPRFTAKTKERIPSQTQKRKS